MENIIFESAAHEKKYFDLLHRAEITADSHNPELKAVLYLLALIRRNENSLYDFKENVIKPESIGEPWQTGNTARATRLMFILWNGYNAEPDQSQNSIYNIFGYSEWDKYYIQALKIRYPYTTE